MKSYDSEIQIWCERKYQEAIGELGTDNVDIHVYAYGRGGEWVVCDIFAHGYESQVVDITFSFGDYTKLDDLYSPQVKDVVILFEVLGHLVNRFKSHVHFGMPEREAIVKPERQGRELDREPMTRIDYKDFLPEIDEESMEEKTLRIAAQEKALAQLKQRLNALGLKWMNKEQSQNELERLLSGIENRKQTLDDLETAQWHYMDIVEITSSGIFDEKQLERERRDQPHLIKKEDGLTVFEDDQCILFMSQNHGIPLPLCAAYVLSDAWR